jgi:hypothetical protein
MSSGGWRRSTAQDECNDSLRRDGEQPVEGRLALPPPRSRDARPAVRAIASAQSSRRPHQQWSPAGAPDSGKFAACELAFKVGRPDRTRVPARYRAYDLTEGAYARASRPPTAIGISNARLSP